MIGRSSLGSGSEAEECSILSVKLDVENDPKYTKLDVQVGAKQGLSILTHVADSSVHVHACVQVMNYPALLRTVAWTLNGE